MEKKKKETKAYFYRSLSLWNNFVIIFFCEKRFFQLGRRTPDVELVSRAM